MDLATMGHRAEILLIVGRIRRIYRRDIATALANELPPE
jgi:hypothetical protein